MLFAAVTHLVEKLILDMLPTSEKENALNLLKGHARIKCTHNRTTVNVVLKNVNMK
jgi:hypothetical protein